MAAPVHAAQGPVASAAAAARPRHASSGECVGVEIYISALSPRKQTLGCMAYPSRKGGNQMKGVSFRGKKEGRYVCCSVCVKGSQSHFNSPAPLPHQQCPSLLHLLCSAVAKILQRHLPRDPPPGSA